MSTSFYTTSKTKAKSNSKAKLNSTYMSKNVKNIIIIGHHPITYEKEKERERRRERERRKERETHNSQIVFFTSF